MKIKTFILTIALLACGFAVTAAPMVVTNAAGQIVGVNDPNPPPPMPATSTDTNSAPTIGGGLQQIIAAIQSGTNLIWEAHALYAPGLKRRMGGGIGALIPINTYLFASIRLDWVDGGFWMPQGNVGLQLPIPIKVFGTTVTVTPFIYGGIAVPVSGATVGSFTLGGSPPIDNNGQPTAIMGAGGAITLYSPWKMDLVGDIEEWSNFPGKQYRGGLTFGL